LLLPSAHAFFLLVSPKGEIYKCPVSFIIQWAQLGSLEWDNSQSACTLPIRSNAEVISLQP
jgi:hypothetical protein